MKKWNYILPLLLLAATACEDPNADTVFTVYDDIPSGSYLESRPDDFSEWVSVLRYADLFNAMNQASYTYTLFVPTNKAVREFYEKKHVTDVTELDTTYVRELVKYHILADTVTLDKFIEGGQLVPKTLTDDFITVTFGESQGTAGINSLYLNGESHLGELSIPTSNGLIYVLNDVQRPMIESVYQQMVDNDQNRILAEAMDLTGWRQTLNVIADYDEAGVETRRYYTILGVPDEVYQAAGITSVEGLVSRLGAGSDYTSPSNALYQYVGYHILGGNRRVADLKTFDPERTSRLWESSTENALMKISQEEGAYYINHDGGTEGRASLIESRSDYVVKNGYIHQLDGWLPICTTLKPISVYFDIADYAELASYVASNGGECIYQTPVDAEKSVNVSDVGLPCYPYTMGPLGKVGNYDPLTYYTVKNSNYEYTNCLNNDFLLLSLGYMGHVTFTTPPILPGRYRVSVVYIYANSMDPLRLYQQGSNGGLTTFEIPSLPILEPANAVLYASLPTDQRMGIYTAPLYEDVQISQTMRHQVKVTLSDPAASLSTVSRVQIDYFLFEPIN